MEKEKNRFLAWANYTIVMLFLVIFAGGFVRATHSGMGCPDWPKCYGYIIPPNDVSTLIFAKGKSFEKGQMIILNDTLWVAQNKIVNATDFNRIDWHKYPKHNVANYSVAHTWIEYVNRLLGAVTGIFILAVFIVSLPFWHFQKSIVILCFSLFIITGFQGWFGSLVVSSNLAPYKITIHMLLALLILVVLYTAIYKVKTFEIVYEKVIISNKAKYLVAVTLILALVQIVIGTHIRGQIDTIADANHFNNRETWINNLGAAFMTHKNLAFLILILTFIYSRDLFKLKMNPFFSLRLVCLFTIILEISAGLILNYFKMPMWVQPIHLLLAASVFMSQFQLFIWIWLRRQIEGEALVR